MPQRKETLAGFGVLSPMSHKLVIPQTDYSRIFRVIFSVLDGRAQTHQACSFFAMAGAGILRKHYNLKAHPLSGGAAYAVNDEDAVVATFGRIENNELMATRDAFHCWVECNGFAIDFMTPIFQENLQAAGSTATVPRRMFQKPLAAMSPTLPQHFSSEGMFHLVPSLENTESMIKSFDAPAKADLAALCVYWYRRPPAPMNESLDIQDDLGRITRLKLHGPDISGAW